jgi:xylan 1,4-beta-xylosidase
MSRAPLLRRAILGSFVCAAFGAAWGSACPVSAGQARPRPATFCNPIALNDDLGLAPGPQPADPAVLFFKGEYWVFTSASATYWHSPDFVNWRQVQPSGLPKANGAPALVVLGGRLHLLPSGARGLYATDDPGQGDWTMVADTAAYPDPELFLDDDGRIYLYYGSAEHGPISGVELDPADRFKVVRGPVECTAGDPGTRGWEVYGEDNRGAPYRGRMRLEPWISGAAMIKHGGRYYLQYAAPGDDLATSASGVFVASSPLGPFAYAPYSPLARRTTGFVSGIGHGRVFADATGRLWYVSGIATSPRAGRARRLALFPAGFLPDGQLAVDTYLGDYPQYAPGRVNASLGRSSPGWLLLSRNKRSEASSSKDGFPAENAFDENARTRWSAVSGRAGEWLSVDLGRRCRIDALQLSFSAEGHSSSVEAEDRVCQYSVEVSDDGRHWALLYERRDGARAAMHDYLPLDRPIVRRFVRVLNIHTPGEAPFSVSELRVFGHSREKPPKQVQAVAASRDPADPRRLRVSWTPAKGAGFHIVRHGTAADRLFGNHATYDSSFVEIGSLNVGVPYFVSIDAVNESGVTRAKTVVAVK